MKTLQTHFRVSVSPAFQGLDTPQRHPSEAVGFRVAAQLRRELERCIDAATSCQPASLTANMDRLASIRAAAETILPLVPEGQRLRSDRNLVHPLTLADWIEAARITGIAHRSPHWAPIGCDRLDHIEAKLDSLAALICKLGVNLKDGGAL